MISHVLIYTGLKKPLHNDVMWALSPGGDRGAGGEVTTTSSKWVCRVIFPPPTEQEVKLKVSDDNRHRAGHCGEGDVGGGGVFYRTFAFNHSCGQHVKVSRAELSR